MEFSALFPIRESCLYLDHAQLAPLPEPSVKAIAETLAQHQQEGFWDRVEVSQLDQKVRLLLAQLAGCQASDVSFFPDSVTALTTLLLGLEFPKKGRVLLATEDPEELRPLSLTLQRFGLSTTLAATARWPQLVELVEGLFDDLAFVYFPWVDALGWVAPIQEILQHLKDRSCTVVLDGSQAVPCRPETFPELGVDALLVPSHTWLLGPRGVTALVSTPEMRQHWRPLFPAWRKPSENSANDAACFEAPALPPFVFSGWAASLELLLGAGIGFVRNRLLAHQHTVTSTLLELGWSVGSPGAAHSVAGIVVAQHPFFPAHEVQQRLRARHVWVGTVGPWVRLSPHFYTTVAELNALEKILRRL